MTRINGWACFFLVTLRMAIGWHFLVEGVHKIHTHRIGKTSTNAPWSGEAFFREGYGPAAPFARKLLELDKQMDISRFELDTNRTPTLMNEWQQYLERFSQHYDLTEDQAKSAYDKMKSEIESGVKWLTGQNESALVKNYLWGPVTTRMTVPQRLSEIKIKLQQADDDANKKLRAYNADVEKARLRALKSEINQQIAELDREWKDRTATMKSSLATVLTADQLKKGSLAEDSAMRRIDQLDKVTMWAHAILGGLLLVGLFTRMSSFLLAMFLMSVTLIAPAVPWAPTPPGSIGHYLYINLYTIEMIALFALVCMPTGRWFGIDAVFGRRRAAPAQSNGTPNYSIDYHRS